MAEDDMDEGRFAPGDVIEGEVVESTKRAMQRVGGGQAFPVEEMAMAVAISKADLDQQIMTAKAHRRGVQNCLDNIMSLATLTTKGAEECNYALPRGYEDDPATGKKRRKIISGPSIRLMEIVANQWGNNRYGVLTIDIDRPNKVVKVTAFHHDLETNSRVETLVTRRISDSKGRLFNDDMITVTGNAAGSIALRNAIQRGVPRPVWSTAYDRVLSVIRGDEKSLAARRVELLEAFKRDLNIPATTVYQLLAVKGEQDIGLDELVAARGFYSAMKNNEITVEDLLKEMGAPSRDASRVALSGANGQAPAKPAADPPKDTGHKLQPRQRREADAAAAGADKETGEIKDDPKPGATTTAASTGTSASESQSETDSTDDDHVEAGDADGPAPADVVYFLASDDKIGTDGRRQTYRDGDPMSRAKADNPNIPTYAAHPVEQEQGEDDAGADADEGAAEDGAADPSRSPASSGASQTEASESAGEADLSDYFEVLGGCASVNDTLTAYDELLASDEWGTLGDDGQREARSITWDRVIGMAPDFKPESDPAAFEAWLATGPNPSQVEAAHKAVIRARSYRTWSEDRKDALSRAVAVATGKA